LVIWGEGGPKNWGRIKKEFATCRTGKTQSPVNIIPTIDAYLDKLEIDYKNVPLKILNNGHTVQVNYPAGSKMSVGGDVYNVLQFHFHTLSENLVKGHQYDMEIHFVHKTDDGRLGVLAVMIESGTHNTEVQKIWDHLPMSITGEKTFSSVTLNGSNLLPDRLSYYRFMGSLTTPPCTEGVNWHVLKQPIQFSPEQIAKFKSAFPTGNARPAQPGNARLVVENK